MVATRRPRAATSRTINYYLEPSSDPDDPDLNPDPDPDPEYDVNDNDNGNDNGNKTGNNNDNAPITLDSESDGEQKPAARSKRKRARPPAPVSQDDSKGSQTGTTQSGQATDPAPAKKQKKPFIRRRMVHASYVHDMLAEIHHDWEAHKVFHYDVVSKLPERLHSAKYHIPLLLDPRLESQGAQGRHSLLAWFDSNKKVREMPWRQEWLNPHVVPPDSESQAAFQAKLKERGYRVWLSEIMLQQTRVATVLDYFNRWTARWPTIESLAQAEHDEVLAQWKGLGYYNRATRIHQVAKQLVDDPVRQGMLPSKFSDLRGLPGIGQYTAGAISSIVYGHAQAVVDGNVVRVLSRQMAYRGPSQDSQSQALMGIVGENLVRQAVIDTLDPNRPWIPDVELPTTPIPGAWNQALMELGSTLCLPTNPQCGQCPIRTTCRTFTEGSTLAASSGETNRESPAVKAESTSTEDKATAEPSVGDIEDICHVCEPFDPSVLEAALQPPKGKSKSTKAAPSKGKPKSVLPQSSVQMRLPFASPKAEPTDMPTAVKPVNGGWEDQIRSAQAYAQFFPCKKKETDKNEDEVLVCLIENRTPDGQVRFALEQRPPTGLLANMWQFPSMPLHMWSNLNREWTTLDVQRYVTGVVRATPDGPSDVEVQVAQKLGSLVHVFSHLKLCMHIFHIKLAEGKVISYPDKAPDMPRRWATVEEVENANMGTGMVNVWKRLRGSPLAKVN